MFYPRFWTDDDFYSRRPSLFCSDVSYWMSKPCLSEHDFFNNGYAKYTEVRRCKYYDSNYTVIDLEHSCPRGWEFCKERQKCLPRGWPCRKNQCKSDKEWFYCPKSQKCIHR